MKFLATLALMATAALATPVAKSPKEFHLKTAGANNAKFNDLFVYAYHTGAGLNDAVLSKDNTIASAFYFNGTMALADLKTEFPWGMIAPGDANYACKCEFKSQREALSLPGKWEMSRICQGKLY